MISARQTSPAFDGIVSMVGTSAVYDVGIAMSRSPAGILIFSPAPKRHGRPERGVRVERAAGQSRHIDRCVRRAQAADAAPDSIAPAFVASPEFESLDVVSVPTESRVAPFCV